MVIQALLGSIINESFIHGGDSIRKIVLREITLYY